MDQDEELDFQEAADDFLPPQPELPPVENPPSPLATGKDQNAGEPREWGHSPVAPAFVPPEAVPPETDVPKYKLDPPETLHYEDAEPSFPVEKMPAPPSLPPVPRVRNPGRERKKKMRAAKKAAHEAAESGEMLELSTAKEWNTTTTELNDEWVRLWEGMTRAMRSQTNMIALYAKIIDDQNARLLDLERWAQQWTIPGSVPRTF